MIQVDSRCEFLKRKFPEKFKWVHDQDRMEEGEHENIGGEGVKQNGAEVTAGQKEEDTLDISSRKEGAGIQAEEQDEARKSSVEQEMERCYKLLLK